MSGLLTRKLQTYLSLPEPDVAALEALRSESRTVPAKTEISLNAPRQAIHQIRAGYAYRCRQLSDGRRQVCGFMIPGDFIDLRKLVMTGTQHTIISLSEIALDVYQAAPLLRTLEMHPRTAQAIWRSLLSEESIAEEWLVSLGKRTALERIAHLLAELYVRHVVISGAVGDSFALPITQSELGDTMGLSTVHVNRTLKVLRQRNLVRMQSGRVDILDFRGLAALGLFSPEYLHFRSRSAAAGTAPPRSDMPPEKSPPTPSRA